MGDFKSEIIVITDNPNPPADAEGFDGFHDYMPILDEKAPEQIHFFNSYSYDHILWIGKLFKLLAAKNPLGFGQYPCTLKSADYQFFINQKLEELDNSLLTLKNEIFQNHEIVSKALQSEGLRAIDFMAQNPMKDAPKEYSKKEQKDLEGLRNYYEKKFNITKKELCDLYDLHDGEGYNCAEDYPADAREIVSKAPRFDGLTNLFQSLGYLKAFHTNFLPKAKASNSNIITFIF